jgi:hypothetical protein
MSTPRLRIEEPPDLWPEIERRLAELGPVGHRTRGRIFTVVLALVVFGASAVFVWRSFTPAERSKRPTVGPLDGIRQGWTRLANPPEARPGAAYVWTGSELFAWSGCDPSARDECVPTRDGFAFNPATERWTAMPGAPAAIPYAHAVWTGDEVVYLSLTSGQQVGGLAYRPSTSAWRTIADAPLAPRDGAAVVWTGSRIFVWGGGERADPAMDGALYDPLSDTWTSIARSPIGLNQASGVWTGSQVIVFGALLSNGNLAATDTSVGAAYDPVTNTWRALPVSKLSPQAVAAVWAGDRMVAWDYGWKAEAYVPSADSWHELPSLRFHSGECYPDGTVVAGEVFAFGCGEVATWTPGDEAWQAIHGGMTDATIEANAGRYQLWRFATLVPAGDVLFLAAEGLTVDKDGVPCYGCAGSPTSLWAYRPAE